MKRNPTGKKENTIWALMNLQVWSERFLQCFSRCRYDCAQWKGIKRNNFPSFCCCFSMFFNSSYSLQEYISNVRGENTTHFCWKWIVASKKIHDSDVLLHINTIYSITFLFIKKEVLSKLFKCYSFKILYAY